MGYFCNVHARTGQILLSEETAKRLAGRFLLRSVGTLRRKNLSQAVPVWEALASTPLPPPPK